MKSFKVGIIGYFAEGKSKAGGQEAKTCTLDKALKDKYGKEAVYNVDTTNWKKYPIAFVCKMIVMAIRCRNIVMLPAQNSIKIYIPFFEFLNIFLHRNLCYSVVGGWLPQYLKSNSNLCDKCKRLNEIWVETKSMKTELDEMGFKNVSVIPNFKFLEPLKSDDVEILIKKPYKLCTFSRIMLEKGIEDIIAAVNQINEEKNEMVFTLYIYGKIDDGYQKRFNELKKLFPNYIRYMGMVEPNQSVETIREYFALVFPTHYYTEGVPGTLIDASMAGVPVICSLWKNYAEVFVEGITGWGYEFNNQNELIKVLEKVADCPEEFCKMRKFTLEEAKKYTPRVNVEKIIRKFK